MNPSRPKSVTRAPLSTILSPLRNTAAFPFPMVSVAPESIVMSPETL